MFVWKSGERGWWPIVIDEVKLVMKKWWLVGVALILVIVVGGMVMSNSRKETRNEILETGIEQKTEKVETLKFAVMADIHNDTESLAKALVHARANGDEMVLVAGDLTIDGTKAEEEKIKTTLEDGGIEYFVVPGNHDTYKNVWLWQEKFQSVRKGGLKFLLIDNSNWRGLGDGQKRWLGDELPECKIIRCVAVMHMPLLNNFSKHVMGEYSKTTAMEAVWLKNILLENKVTTGYSGHLHYSSSYTVDGWETVLVGAISKERNTQTPRYSEVTVFDDGNVENKVKLII